MINLIGIANAVRKRAQAYIKERRPQTITIDVAELFFQQNEETGFMRYDTIVRLLAVEEYHGINNYGFDLYKRLQSARNGDEWVNPAVKRFKELIQSYEDKGYDKNSEIVLDKHLRLYDGSHRLALALYYGQKEIKALVEPREHNIFFGIEWFRINGFSEDECRLLQSKYEELKNKYMTPFICSLWAPVYKYFDEITKHLELFGRVVEVRDYDLNEWNYNFYTRGIYYVDDIEKWKIEKKIEYMKKSASGCYKIRMVAIQLEHPDFRLKGKTGTTLSQRGELIKRIIRDAYKEKISNYFHDIILHIGDNFYQSRYIHQLLTMPHIDIKSILTGIHDRKYVIIKYDVPYAPVDFPEHYALGKDLDIICGNEEEYQKVLNVILAELEKYTNNYNIRVVQKEKKEGKDVRTLVRIEHQRENFLIFQFDVSSSDSVNNLQKEFTDNMLASRVGNGIFFLPKVKYELVLRMKEIHDFPEKSHHLEYIKSHINDIDEKLCDNSFNFEWRKILKFD